VHQTKFSYCNREKYYVAAEAAEAYYPFCCTSGLAYYAKLLNNRPFVVNSMAYLTAGGMIRVNKHVRICVLHVAP